MRKIFAVCALAMAFGAMAQESVQESIVVVEEKAISAPEPKFSIVPTGRVLMDAALYASPQKEDFKDGGAIPEVRLGAKLTYDKWTCHVSAGFARNKLALKDLYVQYDFNPKWVMRIGSFIHQYGLQSSTSSSLKSTFEEPLSHSAFGTPWLMGAMGMYNGDKFFGALSVHLEPKAIQYSPNEMNHQGWGVLTRLVARPLHSDGKTVQVGISGGYASPQGNVDGQPDDSFSFGANFPTRVDLVKAINVTVDDALNMWKFTPELLLTYGRVTLESQYFFTRVNRKQHLHSFTGQGAYVNVRSIILGTDYGYSMLNADVAMPKPKSLEFVAGYNYTTLTDSKAGFFGGRVNTFSATLNYYINRYMIARLNYTYTYRWDDATLQPVTLNVFQARLQFIF